jgi:putative lipoprotein (rSAM/lipoprotein system)
MQKNPRCFLYSSIFFDIFIIRGFQMKQITSKGRLLLRRFLTALSIGAVAITFQACYGVPMVTVTGTVKARDTNEPIPGIQILIDENEYHEMSDSEGNFELFIERWTSDKKYNKKIIFKDIDGPENGEFQDKEMTVDTKVDLNLHEVFLERK